MKKKQTKGRSDTSICIMGLVIMDASIKPNTSSLPKPFISESQRTCTCSRHLSETEDLLADDIESLINGKL